VKIFYFGQSQTRILFWSICWSFIFLSCEMSEEWKSAESKRSKYKDRVAVSELKMLEEEDRLRSSIGDEGRLAQEIVYLNAKELWASDKVRLAEATVELTGIDLAISLETKKSDGILVTQVNPELAEAKKEYAQAKVQLAETSEKLLEVRISNAQDEKERERLDRMLENASMKLKVALNELASSTANQIESETLSEGCRLIDLPVFSLILYPIVIKFST